MGMNNILKDRLVDYYGVLGLDATDYASITTTEIKKRYRALALELHPDKQAHTEPSEKERREALFKQVGTAYGILGDSTNRENYDKKLGRALPVTPNSGQKSQNALELEDGLRRQLENAFSDIPLLESGKNTLSSTPGTPRKSSLSSPTSRLPTKFTPPKRWFKRASVGTTMPQKAVEPEPLDIALLELQFLKQRKQPFSLRSPEKSSPVRSQFRQEMNNFRNELATFKHKVVNSVPSTPTKSQKPIHDPVLTMMEKLQSKIEKMGNPSQDIVQEDRIESPPLVRKLSDENVFSTWVDALSNTLPKYQSYLSLDPKLRAQSEYENQVCILKNSIAVSKNEEEIRRHVVNHMQFYACEAHLQHLNDDVLRAWVPFFDILEKNEVFTVDETQAMFRELVKRITQRFGNNTDDNVKSVPVQSQSPKLL